MEPESDVETGSPPIANTVQRLAEGPRVLGDLGGCEGGPTLIVVGGLHGNEPAGVLALGRIFECLGPRDGDSFRGRIVGLAGNRQALTENCRFIRQDLNRIWSAERLAGMRGRTDPLTLEDAEMHELDGELERILRQAAGQPVYLLDIHTTSGPGPAFANLDDTLPNRDFALDFPVTLVVGIEEELAGTLASYLFDEGVITIGFESGQHQEDEAVDRAEAAIWIALEASGILKRGSRPEIAAARRLLKDNRGSLPHVVEVLHRHPIRGNGEFRMLPGFRNFQPVTAGQPLADNHHGRIVADRDGLILMPLYQAQGEDGYFLVQEVRPMWLKLSEYVRRLRLERFLGLLPGVRSNPELEGSFTIDRRYARWAALEIFHLLGFRRQADLGRHLVMARRAHDR